MKYTSGWEEFNKKNGTWWVHDTFGGCRVVWPVRRPNQMASAEFAHIKLAMASPDVASLAHGCVGFETTPQRTPYYTTIFSRWNPHSGDTIAGFIRGARIKCHAPTTLTAPIGRTRGFF